MKQYGSIKERYPDAILLFRMGDFYETFGPDAITMSKVLGIVLTKRHNGGADQVELAGFPHHSLNMYLPKLVRAGHRVAICEQLEDPKLTKKLVKRGVTEVVTPGVALNEQILDNKTNNYLASVHFAKNGTGVALIDISTGEFLLAEGSLEYIDKLLQGFQPSEIIFSKSKKDHFKEQFGNKHYTYPIDEWIYAFDYANEMLLRHFGTKSLKGFGVQGLTAGIVAAGAIIHYLGETQHSRLQHITSIGRIQRDKYVWLDRFTIRNLELLQSTHPSGTPLIKVLDKTISPMGARLLKKWVALPLMDKTAIAERADVVCFFMENEAFAYDIEQQIKQMGDVERLIARVPMGRINPRQVVQLKKALKALEPIKEMCVSADNAMLCKIGEQLNPCQLISEQIGHTLVEEPPISLAKGEVIADGVSEKLDELRQLMRTGKQYLVEIQQREAERTGITSLKIGFNNVFGYYLEVRNRFKEQVPEEWIRKQTLVSSERYITAELKEYEEKIVGAEEKAFALEQELYNQLIADLNDYIRPIQLNAALIARLDCLHSFAKVAAKNNYCRPQINDSLIIDIKQGRHPVIEQQLELGEQYVPNDIYLDSDNEQLLILTGPNMSGKSALLRQTALIVLMAQMGAFVPASKVTMGLVDKVFTRVGASDNISSGESTFMVEMNETASIMNNISPRSLILLDEIGRGTSTFDGISIAWALAEYLHHHGKARPKTLFATHYHELTELAKRLERVRNYSIAVKEAGNKVIFLRTLIPQAAQRSFGIHVAQMAGMPKTIVNRANEILAELESKSIAAEATDVSATLKAMPQKPIEQSYQLNIFDAGNPILTEIGELLRKTNVNEMTPVEALIKLNELKNLLKD